jgi:hypothetical protein
MAEKPVTQDQAISSMARVFIHHNDSNDLEMLKEFLEALRHD